MRQSLYAVFILLAIFSMVGLILLESKWNMNDTYEIFNNTKEEMPVLEKTSQEKCRLPYDKNPWDESIMPHFNHLYGYQKQCNHDALRTSFSKGKLLRTRKDDYCWGRCLYWKDDWEYRTGNWTNGTKSFGCDVIEARCATNGNIEEFDYFWLHTQIYENEKLKNSYRNLTNTGYDVMLLLIDSTSYTQSLRNLGRTVTYLIKGLNAVPFPYLNRAGMNTKPNMFQLFQGAIPEPVDRSMFNEPSLAETVNIDSLCHRALDNYTFIQEDFQKNNYITSWFEDWHWGWTNYPNCIGNQEKQAEHMNSPFRLAWTETNNKRIEKIIKKQNYCASKHQLMMYHVAQFFKSYEGMPKMTTVFDTDLGHNDVSTSVEADDIFYDFFIKNREILKKSFIFFMGDHGLRLGPSTSSKMGQFEVNNPMLYVIPPADLVKNKELMNVLRENSKKLQTHMELRETLFDIMKHQPATNFSDRKPRNDNPHGNSLLRVQNGERSCRTLPIPFQYCMCEYKEEKQNLNSTYAQKIGQFVATYVNQQLADANLSIKCWDWVFSQVTVLTKLDAADNLDIYKIEVEVQPKATFRTMVTDLRNGTFLVGTLDRADRYGSRGDCVEGKYRLLCDCRPTV